MAPSACWSVRLRLILWLILRGTQKYTTNRFYWTPPTPTPPSSSQLMTSLREWFNYHQVIGPRISRGRNPSWWMCSLLHAGNCASVIPSRLVSDFPKSSATILHRCNMKPALLKRNTLVQPPGCWFFFFSALFVRTAFVIHGIDVVETEILLKRFIRWWFRVWERIQQKSPEY